MKYLVATALLSIMVLFSPTTQAGEKQCREKIIASLTSKTWTLTTHYDDKIESLPVIFERIDGGVQVKLDRKPQVKISDDCDSIVINWKPNEGKEYYLKVTGSAFDGYRTKGSTDITYGAVMKPSGS